MQKVQRKVYFDNASTTKLNDEVLSSYNKLLATYFENSDSLYDDGVKVKNMQEQSRKFIANFFNVDLKSVIFTSSGSEANNLAIKGVVFANKDKKHIITSSIEHSSVLNCINQLKEYFDYDVTILQVDKNGKINPNDVKNNLRNDTILVSIMHVNNEVGSINPIYEIADIVKRNSSAYFHVDMVQSLGKEKIDLSNIDMASFSAHKINGLKGSGLLIKKPHVKIIPLINGGQQEFSLRGGSSNSLVNALFYKTIRLYFENENNEKVYKLKNMLINNLNEIENIQINSPKDSVNNIINFSYPKIPSEVMMNALNMYGIMVSAQSTCSSNSHNPNKVLKAMGYSDLIANSCIRISLSKENSEDEVLYFIKCLKEIIKKYGNL